MPSLFLGLWRPVLCNLQNIGALDESAPFDFRHVELELRYNFLYCLSKNCRKVKFSSLPWFQYEAAFFRSGIKAGLYNYRNQKWKSTLFLFGKGYSKDCSRSWRLLTFLDIRAGIISQPTFTGKDNLECFLDRHRPLLMRLYSGRHIRAQRSSWIPWKCPLLNAFAFTPVTTLWTVIKLIL